MLFANGHGLVSRERDAIMALSAAVLSGALLPHLSMTAPAHPPYPSLRIDPAQPHLNSRPQP